MKKGIYVFTLNGCSHCENLKKRLDISNVTYKNVEITQNRDIWREVVKLTGHDVLPTVFVQTDDEGNGTVYIPGIDFNNEDEIMKILEG